MTHDLWESSNIDTAMTLGEVPMPRHHTGPQVKESMGGKACTILPMGGE